MKFQDDISNMNTYIHTYIHTYIRTYIHTDKPKPICPPTFSKLGHKNYRGWGLGRVGESGWGVRVDVNTELKFLGKFTKNKWGGGSGWM